MVKFSINSIITDIPVNNYGEIVQHITEITNLAPEDFYLEQNGKRLQEEVDETYILYVRLRILGGKGGFGSMLRAIGAQIEKTTNREACRDLSGRRLGDINEEKRLKAWLEKQGEREREAEERKKRKIEKLLAVPKHEFKDAEYEKARSKLTEKVCDAVEEGFKTAGTSAADLKRKNEASTSQAVKAKKKKPGLWLDDDLSSDDSDDSDDNSDASGKEDKKSLSSKDNTDSDDSNTNKDSEDSNINDEKLSDKDTNSMDAVKKLSDSTKDKDSEDSNTNTKASSDDTNSIDSEPATITSK